MRIVRSNQAPDKINVMVRVQGFRTDPNGDPVQITGTNLRTGRPVAVELTTTGKAAENPKRLPVSKLAKGFRVGRDTYQLGEGGVVVLKDAFPDNNRQDVYIGRWLEVYAYTKQAAENNVVLAPVSLSLIERKLPNQEVRRRGFVTLFDPEMPILTAQINSAKELGKLKDELRGWLGEVGLRHNIIVRAVNTANQITGIDSASARFHRPPGATKSVPLTADQSTDALMKRVMAVAQGRTGRIEVMCNDVFSVSPAELAMPQAGPVWGGLASFYTKHTHQPDGSEATEIYALPSIVQLAHHESGVFVTAMAPAEPWGPKLDPGLFGPGQLSYAQSQDVLDEPGSHHDDDETASMAAAHYNQFPPQDLPKPPGPGYLLDTVDFSDLPGGEPLQMR